MGVNIFAASKEIAKELEFVARWTRTGDDTLDLRPSIERCASFLPFFERCVTDVWAIAADDDLAVRLRYMNDCFLELEYRVPDEGVLMRDGAHVNAVLVGVH